MEKAAEHGSAVLREITFQDHTRSWNLYENSCSIRPSLSTIITENDSVPMVSPSDSIILAAKKMREYRVNSLVVMTGNKLLGILTSKDLVLRVVAQNLSPVTTFVEKAMTACPECATLETSILDALHLMQDKKFPHIPVVDKSGRIIGCLDALRLAHAAISMVEGSPGSNNVANSMMQKFWDSALALHPAEEYDDHSEEYHMVSSDNAEGKQICPPPINSSFSFKVKDRKGLSESLDELVSAVAYRLGMNTEK